MPLYETTFIVRQDASSQEVEKHTENFANIIKELGGAIVKVENWGLRDLAYPIKKSLKGYYVLMGINCSFEALTELTRKIKLNEDVIRCVSFNVEEISMAPSALIAPYDNEGEEIIIGGKESTEQRAEV